jgi:hypothetical protein
MINYIVREVGQKRTSLLNSELRILNSEFVEGGAA